MELFKNGEKVERRAEDQIRPTQGGPSYIGNPFIPKTIERAAPPDTAELQMVRTPNSQKVNAMRYGLSQVDAGLAGMADLVARGADWFYPGDEVTGIENPYLQFMTPEASEARRESFYGVPPGYEPTGQLEKLINVGTQGAGMTAAGGMGLGPFRAIPAGIKGGLAAYRRGLTSDYARNAAGLLASNTAGVGISEGLQDAGVDSLPLEIGLSMMGGMGADSIARRGVRRVQGRKGSKARRDAISNLPDDLKPVDTPLSMGPNPPLGRLVDALRSRFRARIQDGAYTEGNLVDSRDRVMEALFGRLELLTDADIETALAQQGMQAAENLKRQKRIQDDILAEIQHFADLYEQGRPVPSLYGILAGAGLSNTDQGSLARLMAQGPFVQELQAANARTLDDVAGRVREMVPEGATGTPQAIREAGVAAEVAARETARAPFERPEPGVPSRVSQILRGDGRIPTEALRVRESSIQRAFEGAREAAEMGGAYERVLKPAYRELEDWLSNPRTLDETGMVSLEDFYQFRRRLQGMRNAPNTDDELRAYLGTLVPRLDRMVMRRLRHRDNSLYEELTSYNAGYSETMDNYAKSRPRTIESSTDATRQMKADVANALINPQSSASESASLLSTARRLDTLSGLYGPKAVADQVRVVMNDNPARLAEVEASLLNRIMESASDPASTARRITKAQEMVDGPSFSQDEGRMMALYREFAGNEKADAIPDLLREARAARADPTFEAGQAWTTNSQSLARMQAAEKAIEGAEVAVDAASGLGAATIFRLIRFGMGKFDPDLDERRVSAAFQTVWQNPPALLELLRAPSRQVYEEWQNKFLPRAGRTTAREGSRANARRNNKD